MMHLLSAGMHNANSDSSAGFSQLHLVSLGTTYRNALRCPKRIRRRSVSAFLRHSVFLCSEGQWNSTPQNAIGKTT